MTSSLLGMVCPSCRVALVMSERQGIEIDYCPQCRGVWLDRGELDKIVERSGRDASPAPQPQPAPFAQPQHGRDRDDDYSRSHGHRYPKRKKSFFEELFD
ncbi:zf-TFIIB domain-containing protein [Mesorhizobium sp. BR115XR7A]|uniref:TFIIB-type zinc ribbon-containing protein n=1 Tax=Mesorhizobium sp. BR115XR7A TaxID=2876645 RepID=UPI001CCC03E7|nr:zf-TFIIB domain-containing protein [Mesorhizobium sp. BR115XR7A]MBZ9906497.1 zf-TFIIB domain-containing protein [Mesorhizobium sp. BR115XR7A]MBZ9928608.1 zf-TFIIB domain-containing protein [Mesorhizobium sp. BR1-1-5]